MKTPLLQDAANATLRSETLWETVCDAIIANGGVKNHQKRSKMFVMEDASNTVQILVACVMQGIRFSSINCLRWGGTKETGSQMKVCDIEHMVHSDELFVIRQHKRNGQPDQCVCDVQHTVHSDELFVITQYKKRSARSRCVRYTHAVHSALVVSVWPLWQPFAPQALLRVPWQTFTASSPFPLNLELL